MTDDRVADKYDAYREAAHTVAKKYGTEFSDEQIAQLWEAKRSVLEIENAVRAWKHDQDIVQLIKETAERERRDG